MEQKTCPKCGSSFSCNSSVISECWCLHAKANKEALEKIAGLYDDCLCEKCLTTLQSPEAGTNEDFYLTPEGYTVFTAAWHLKRGYCCRNNCRHCPY